MDPLLILFILNIFLITSHSIFIMYKYKPYLTSKLQGKSIWDKTYDWLRLLSNVTFIFVPFFLLQWIRNNNSNNYVFNISALLILVILNFILLIISKQFIWSEKIKLNNNIEISQGPGGFGLKYYALKYVLIQHLYKEERLETQKYPSQKIFLIKVGKIENIKPGSLKTHYSKIKFEKNINLLCKENNNIIELLFKNKEFKNYPLVNTFIDDFMNNVKKS